MKSVELVMCHTNFPVRGGVVFVLGSEISYQRVYALTIGLKRMFVYL